MFAVYTNYDSDENGEYTSFLGEEVTTFENVSQGFEELTIPLQNYAKCTSDSRQIPAVVIDMWQKIWQMDDTALGGKRAYKELI
ncbi:MAG TPA: effector binding domain-containing protein [Rickettsia endosymbiont of Degeeriella rufa]|nr:effector binding domain-containing protein [Rickettsia endosymbiont of Degeeriella rufa]